MRIGVEQQRKETLAALADRRGAATHHVVVVEPELEVSASLGHRDNSACSFCHLAQRFAFRPKMHERRTHRIGNHGGEKDRVGERSKAALRWCQQIGEQEVHHCRGEQTPANPEDRYNQETGGHCAEDAAEEIRRRKISERMRRA